MSYLNAPQTEMLATHCAACGKPLVDAESVETGMGPICRKRLLGDAHVDDSVRQEANRVVYEIARLRRGPRVLVLVDQLRAMGFQRLADRIEKRIHDLPVFTIEEIRIGYRLYIPYDADVVASLKKVRGAFFSKEDGKKGWSIPSHSKRNLWNVLQKHYNGSMGMGPKGRFIVE